jgi:hypothetical protein
MSPGNSHFGAAHTAGLGERRHREFGREVAEPVRAGRCREFDASARDQPKLLIAALAHRAERNTQS